MMWLIFGALSALIIGLLLSHSYYKASGSYTGPAAAVSPSATISSPVVDASTKDALHALYENLTIHTESTEHLTPSPKVEVEDEDPRLQIFEEL
jgi:hypothetical protein